MSPEDVQVAVCSMRLQGSNLTGFHYCSLYTFVKNCIATKLLLQLKCVFYFYSCVFFSIYKIWYVVEFLFLQILSSWKHFHDWWISCLQSLKSNSYPILLLSCMTTGWLDVIHILMHSFAYMGLTGGYCMHACTYVCVGIRKGFQYSSKAYP